MPAVEQASSQVTQPPVGIIKKYININCVKMEKITPKQLLSFERIAIGSKKLFLPYQLYQFADNITFI